MHGAAIDFSKWFFSLKLRLEDACHMWSKTGDRAALYAVLSMGSASSPGWACLTSTAFNRRFRERCSFALPRAPCATTVFSDDQLLLAAAPRAPWLTAQLMSEAEYLGFPISRSKARGEHPRSVLTYLGYELDLAALRIALPQAK